MKAIRAWHMSMNYYRNLFMEIAKVPRDKMEKISPYPKGNAFDCTNRLTEMRKSLSLNGYAKEVEAADKRYLETHRGFPSEEKWEEFWSQYLASHDVPKYPKDAL